MGHQQITFAERFDEIPINSKITFFSMKNECDLRGHGHPDESDPLGGHQTDNEDEAMMELEPHVILAD